MTEVERAKLRLYLERAVEALLSARVGYNEQDMQKVRKGALELTRLAAEIHKVASKATASQAGTK